MTLLKVSAVDRTTSVFSKLDSAQGQHIVLETQTELSSYSDVPKGIYITLLRLFQPIGPQ